MLTTNADLLKALDNMTSRSHKLQGEVGKLSKELSALSDYGRRSRFFIRLMVIAFVLDLLLYIVVGVFGWQTHVVSQQAEQASSATVVACVADNASAKTQKELWEFLFKFPPPPGETPAARTQRLRTTAQFKAYIDEAFAQKDCGRGRF